MNVEERAWGTMNGDIGNEAAWEALRRWARRREICIAAAQSLSLPSV